MTDLQAKISWKAATAIVVANMIGSGVFTSLGFQLNDISNTWSVIILWSLGAIMALCGALSYAEIGTQLKRSGGEYHFLSELFHPFAGYLSGWISMTVGFAAPIALSAIALSKYTFVFHGTSINAIAVLVILAVTLMHSINLKKSAIFQNFTTSVKVLIILGFILFGLLHHHPDNALDWGSTWQKEIFYPGFAVSFVYVTFSYSGWNAAAYIIEEIDRPSKNLPRALILGTLIVSIIYLLLNLVFLKNASLADLQGQLEIGQIVSDHIFGSFGGKLMSLAIALMLISGISAMIWAGPRVIKAMADDYRLWHAFKKISSGGLPVRAVLLQSGIAIFMVITGTFERILIYCGFLLNFFAAFTVMSSYVVRKRGLSKDTFKSPFFPIPQIIFLILSAWILIFLIVQQPWESMYGTLNIVVGIATYWMSKKIISFPQ